ncbi:MAG TPA: 50S ribosomal protein L22 [Candidatus Nanoarchaeia archaeon]|nr:50S ribosomal protein L22P [uncultured archaeon]AJS12816.1 50S ribosomal protein L22P [uncultured archaeon]HLC99137.1 50S ribosomal protein L22 [Candidatus Nanoarchaeia archaeon]
MTQYRYSFKDYNKETMARSVGTDLPISTKQSIEICNMLRRVNLIKAKSMLNEVTIKRKAVPFKRFTNGVGHRAGDMASGRYPVKSSKNILSIIESAETNAQQKGLNTSKLSVVHISAQKAANQPRYGRHRGRRAKRTHIEVVLAETAEQEQKKGRHKKESKSEKKESSEMPKKDLDKSFKKEAKHDVKKAHDKGGEKK